MRKPAGVFQSGEGSSTNTDPRAAELRSAARTTTDRRRRYAAAGSSIVPCDSVFSGVSAMIESNEASSEAAYAF